MMRIIPRNILHTQNQKFIQFSAQNSTFCGIVLMLVIHTDKYYSKNSYLGPEEMPVDKKPVVSTVFHANFIASVADTARICYLK